MFIAIFPRGLLPLLIVVRMHYTLPPFQILMFKMLQNFCCHRNLFDSMVHLVFLFRVDSKYLFLFFILFLTLAIKHFLLCVNKQLFFLFLKRQQMPLLEITGQFLFSVVFPKHLNLLSMTMFLTILTSEGRLAAWN
jgi:hypothetical protein